jgi:hypothetical protein
MSSKNTVCSYISTVFMCSEISIQILTKWRFLSCCVLHRFELGVEFLLNSVEFLEKGKAPCREPPELRKGLFREGTGTTCKAYGSYRQTGEGWTGKHIPTAFGGAPPPDPPSSRERECL